jgi:CRISPR-associated RAMP protein, Cmr4 family
VNDKDKVETIFGPEDGSSDFASCISITDAKILLYPVRSVKGVFAWITCPFVLKRFREDLEAVGIGLNVQIFDVSDDKVLVSNSSVLKIDNNQVALEEFVFEVDESQKQKVESLANSLKSILPDNPLAQSLVNHLAIVSDNVFRDFVNYAVEIRTRIRIDQALGTVKKGALFSEELIPSESVFYSILFFKDSFKPGSNIDAQKVFSEMNSLLSDNSLLQLGGDETTGKGYVRVKFNEGNKQSSGQSVNHQQSNVGKN